MEQLVEISASEWLAVYKSLPISGKFEDPKVSDNLFGCLQWTGKDVILKANRKFWSLHVNGQNVSFLHSYFISDKTIRLRGLCTKSDFQRKGYMKILIAKVLEYYKNSATKALCFVSESGKGICQASGFKIMDNFTPRFVEQYSINNCEWIEDTTSKIFLMGKRL